MRIKTLAPIERAGWGLWGLCLGVISVIAIYEPQRCIIHIYRDATLNWWASAPLYSEGIHGFLYLPASAVLFTPFAYLPDVVGGMAWRWLSFGLLTWGIWRLARLALPEEVWRRTVALVLLVSLPAVTVDLVRAQSEMIMMALMIHAAVDLGRQRWGQSAFALCLAVAIKPLALVMLLLIAAISAPMRGRLLIGLGVVLALPFLHPDGAYVLAQYQAMVHKLTVAADPGPGRWNELGAVLHRFHALPDEPTMTGIRLTAALATLALVWQAWRKEGPAMGALALLAFAVSYQLLFNPRTEEGSYDNLTIVAGVYAGLAWHVEQRRWLARALVLLCLGMGTHMYGNWIYRPTDLWLKPLLAGVFLIFISHRVLFRRP